MNTANFCFSCTYFIKIPVTWVDILIAPKQSWIGYFSNIIFVKLYLIYYHKFTTNEVIIEHPGKPLHWIHSMQTMQLNTSTIVFYEPLSCVIFNIKLSQPCIQHTHNLTFKETLHSTAFFLVYIRFLLHIYWGGLLCGYSNRSRYSEAITVQALLCVQYKRSLPRHIRTVQALSSASYAYSTRALFRIICVQYKRSLPHYMRTAQELSSASYAYSTSALFRVICV